MNMNRHTPTEAIITTVEECANIPLKFERFDGETKKFVFRTVDGLQKEFARHQLEMWMQLVENTNGKP
jgi:hypothetical protein